MPTTSTPNPLFPTVRRGALCAAIAGSLALSSVARAGKPDLAKYPLRVHIFRYKARPSSRRDFKDPSATAEYVAGMGQADLFENGEPRGFQFSYSCTVPMIASGGHESLPARWKKKDKTLEILLPEAGKPWNQEGCDLQTEMRTGLVFYWKDGAIAEGPEALLKDWMVKHKFDPENGSEEPVIAAGERVGSGATATTDPFLEAPE
jgi:hypothetical protein